MTGKGPRKPTEKDVETEPDAWERFERAVDVVAKSKPRPKKKSSPDEPGKATRKSPKPKGGS